MKKRKKISIALTSEQLKLCPYGTPACRICRLPVKEIEEIHRLKFSKNWTYRQINEYASARGLFGKCDRTISNHFRKHIDGMNNKKLVKKSPPEVIEVLKGRQATEILVDTDKKVERAYSLLVQMVLDFTKRVDKISRLAGNRLDDDQVLKDEIKNASALGVLSLLSKLQKESISQISAMANLRTPKVIMAHFFKEFIDDVTREINKLLLDVFGSIKEEVSHALSNGGVTDQTFVTVFRNAATEYKNQMQLLRSEAMSNISTALSEMEKIV